MPADREKNTVALATVFFNEIRQSRVKSLRGEIPLRGVKSLATLGITGLRGGGEESDRRGRRRRRRRQSPSEQAAAGDPGTSVASNGDKEPSRVKSNRASEANTARHIARMATRLSATRFFVIPRERSDSRDLARICYEILRHAPQRRCGSGLERDPATAERSESRAAGRTNATGAQEGKRDAQPDWSATITVPCLQEILRLRRLRRLRSG